MSTMTTEHTEQHEDFPRLFLPGMPEQMHSIDLQAAQTAVPAWTKHMQDVKDGPLRRICDCIDANLLQPDLSPDLIARDLGMSRATLYRVAQPLGGIQCFVRNRRLEYAFALIKSDAAAVRSISALAYDLGFGSENTFRRTFKDMFGINPSSARANALA